MTKTAYYFGVFDPIHQGHIAVAQSAKEQFKFNEIIFVPSFSPPHKTPPNHSFKERCELLEEHLTDKPWASVSQIEQKLPEPSYTLQTLQTMFPNLEKQNQDIPFIIGMDAFLSLKDWHHTKMLVQYLWFIVAPRNNLEIPEDYTLKGILLRYNLIAMPQFPISSSTIREEQK